MTMVQKKSNSGGGAGERPRISVKSESELLEDPATKDVVNVHLHAKGRKSFLRKGTDSPEVVATEQKRGEDEEAASAAAAPQRPGGKSPPDPIVTISKVQSQTKEVSVLKSSQHQASSAASAAAAAAAAATAAAAAPSAAAVAAAAAAPADKAAAARLSASGGPPARTSLAVSSAAAAPPPPAATAALTSASLTRAPLLPAHTAPGSLASILGAPRPGIPSQPPGFRPTLRPPTSASGGAASALLRMQSTGLRGPPPAQPSGPMGMPSLHPRPPSGGLGAPSVPLPPAAGPVSEQMQKIASKLVDYMRGTLEDLFRELASQGSLEAQVKALQLEIEKMQWRHQQELSEVKHNNDLILLEMRQTMENERQKIISDLKKQGDMDKQKAIAETKKKQWCAHCGKEAIFYCCWNTSYCDYPCQVRMMDTCPDRSFFFFFVLRVTVSCFFLPFQQAHWPTHMSTCAQNQANQDEESSGRNSTASAGNTSAGPASASTPEGGVDPTATAGGHFLSGQAALAAAAAAAHPPPRGHPGSSLHQAAAAAAARSLQVRSPQSPVNGSIL